MCGNIALCIALLTNVILHCIALYGTTLCIAWLLPTTANTTADVSTKSCRPVGPTMLINVFYISLHLRIHVAQQCIDNGD